MNNKFQSSAVAINIERREPVNNHEAADTTKMVAGQGRKKFLVCAFGVFVSYFYYGILQETM